MSRNQEADKKKLLLRLVKTPIVEVACTQANVPRSTYYRWRKIDEKFAKACDEALEESTGRINDLAESQLISAIKDKNVSAILFWLKHHHKSYRTRIELDANIKQEQQALSPEQAELVARALALRTLYAESAPIRDIDIVAFDEFDPDMSHQRSLSEAYMPDDYAHGYGVHVENLDTYFSSRDLTVNEVAVVDGKLILTKQAEADLREKIIRPTTHEKEAYYGSVGPKLTVKMLLIEQVFQQEYGKGEAVEIDPTSVEPFYIALGLNKAMQYGEPIAQAFVKRLDQLGMLDRDLSINPAELAMELRDITDFIFRGFELAERINRGETISPVNDLLDGDSEFDDLYDRYSRFDVVKNRARANGKGKFRATDVI